MSTEVSFPLLHGFLLLALIPVVFVSLFTRRRRRSRNNNNNADAPIASVNGSSSSSSSLPLPPGSMGWPYVGETLRLYSEHPHAFFSSRQRRHGDVFKTSLLGCPSVMLAGPEAARFVLAPREAAGDRFRPTYPKSKERLIGPWAVMFQSGAFHARVRRLVLGPLMPESLKRLVPSIEEAALEVMRRRLDAPRGNGGVVSIFHVMKEFSFEVGILTIFGGQMDPSRKEQLRDLYRVIDKGYNSFPTMIPGTAYHRAVQARDKLSEIIKEIIAERRRDMSSSSSSDVGGEGLDVLSSLIMRSSSSSKAAAEPALLTDEQIVDNVNGVLFAAQDTTASVLTWVVKYLDDNPKLLQAVKSEQLAIRHQLHLEQGSSSSDGCGEKGLTWALTRHMSFTHKVILESLRMASIIAYTFREAVTDVEYKGYLIPKGWKVMPLFRNIHYSPEFYSDPHKFDPSRFDAPPKPNTFLAFGSGAHSCPGNELAKLEMLVFLHHLVTKYRWETAGGAKKEGGEIEYVPFVVPKGGLPARFWRVSPGEDGLN